MTQSFAENRKANEFFGKPVASLCVLYATVFMYHHQNLSSTEIKRLVKSGRILFAGNKNLKVYGTLHCGSGKRMKKSNRVFFENENEALDLGYRRCGNCMRNRKNQVE